MRVALSFRDEGTCQQHQQFRDGQCGQESQCHHLSGQGGDDQVTARSVVFTTGWISIETIPFTNITWFTESKEILILGCIISLNMDATHFISINWNSKTREVIERCHNLNIVPIPSDSINRVTEIGEVFSMCQNRLSMPANPSHSVTGFLITDYTSVCIEICCMMVPQIQETCVFMTSFQSTTPPLHAVVPVIYDTSTLSELISMVVNTRVTVLLVTQARVQTDNHLHWRVRVNLLVKLGEQETVVIFLVVMGDWLQRDTKAKHRHHRDRVLTLQVTPVKYNIHDTAPEFCSNDLRRAYSNSGFLLVLCGDPQPTGW